jgi:hypothetical protein
MRPKCPACNQRLCAVNYRRAGVTHYRTRCDWCIKKARRVPQPAPRWRSAGYKKKTICDRCGFRSKYAAQLMVYHVDGNLNNNTMRNLKTICQNCCVEVNRLDLTWAVGDLEPDL